MAGTDKSDLKSDEWAECRTTIGRLDTILLDLRKYGFSLIAGLLTASTYVGYASGHPGAGVGAFIAVMCLIAALFSVDIYYSILQSAAVERALDLENASITGEGAEAARSATLITATMSWRATHARSKYVILGVYILLLVIAGALGIVLSAGSGGAAPGLIIATLVVGLPLVAATTYYWNYVALSTHMHRWKPERAWPVPPFNEAAEAPRPWSLPGRGRRGRRDRAAG